MVTTRICVKPHLKEYIVGKYNLFSDDRIRFPDNLDIYHTLFNLTEKRPPGCFRDDGNLEIVLPDRHWAKHPETYNYLGVRSQKIINRKLEIMFWADFREYVDYQHHINAISYIEAVCLFLRRYGIQSISEDAMLKNYYRWRKKIRNADKRGYNKKKFSE
ncbi:MAG: hypothetical protein LBG15_07865 [Dysgonamonadaceae bacterium]|jgi:hypothetical protein|nr:hypothetical protein [Dysgonamonadaceae bacterium]